MTNKSNLKSIRLSDDLIELIEQQAGATFTAKLKNLVTRCVWELPAYYCHSYAAWEKGSVENHNRMIRRFFPKGTDFTHVTKKQVATVQNWMNNYPRKVLNWMTPLEAEATLIA